MDDIDPRLSRIATLWTLVQKAHQQDQARTDAQQAMLERYRGAVYRYLLGCLRDQHAADEVFQEFALRFLEGKFKHAAPEKGRFRDYIKTVLFHLVAGHHRGKMKQPMQADSMVIRGAPDKPGEEDVQFAASWRDELLARTWEALAEAEKHTGQPYHTFLHYRTSHADQDSAAMAAAFSQRLGKPVTAAAVRQTIHRAREKFASLLLDEVCRSLESNDVDALEQEVIDLGLHPYCADAIAKRRKSP